MILSFIVFLIFRSTAVSAAACNRSCGGRVSPAELPSPFGFSAGCKIRLNCTSGGTPAVHDFPVYDVTADSILINLPAKCGRPISAAGALFTANYAPTRKNDILLQNCSSPETDCRVPSTEIQTRFDLLDCGSGMDNISCYSEKTKPAGKFIHFDGLMKSGCKSLFSAVAVKSLGDTPAVAMDIQVVQLEWWLTGDCRCSKNAKCTRIGRVGYRCHCFEGFAGDGYQSGSGCRKEITKCNPTKYLSGKCGGTTKVGVLVGGVVAGAVLMVTVGLICCMIRRRITLHNRSKRRRELCATTGITIPVYPYREMEKATNFFSDKRRLGNGAYGTVYSGKLTDQEWVAIKRIRRRGIDSNEQVINEIKLLSSVNHPNLVRLLGCCIEKGEQILVYEFMPNGTLSQHLQREKGSGLSWAVRLKIASGTAQAVAYLHNAMHPPIYHRDVKSSNILLDDEYRPKVADFGLSRLGLTELSHVSTAPQGTPGYVDPQYHQSFCLSDKSDVYSFGVVLVEIITGLKAVDLTRPQDEVNLAALAVDRIGNGCLHEIIDPLIEPHSWFSVHKVAELAFRCLAFHRDMRPSMMEAAVELEQIRLSVQAFREDYSTAASSSEALSSSRSSSSDASDKPLSVSTEKLEIDLGSFASMNSFGEGKPRA
ncbi:wall-associated receptor kinase-like 14 [Ipomoea triloba]|uniref:wall-associated receptor kinase-like 14 n=1 Tax=Ipomoea triloba TaxID=35885 RepID=UPI00125DF818|nr:wall-associated receptor kinase-like 14 [Ipomoea triloba]